MSLNIQKTELRIYELLGVRFFRVLVFKLEKLVHYKDKGQNTNYHIATYDSISIDAFIKYLFYNGAIHVRNVAFMTVLFVLRYCVFHRVSPFDIILWMLFLKDCYCVMLQRYNYLRIQIRRERLKAKQILRIEEKARVISANNSNIDQQVLEDDLSFIRNMIQKINERDCVIISEEDTQTLLRLKHYLSPK